MPKQESYLGHINHTREARVHQINKAGAEVITKFSEFVNRVSLTTAKWKKADSDLQALKGVAADELAVLDAISQRPTNQTTVAKALGKDKNVLGRLVNRLQDKELLVRMKVGDNRNNILELTDAGRELVKWVNEEYLASEPTQEKLPVLRDLAVGYTADQEDAPKPPKKKKK